jgi:hypothetical protein
MARWSERVMLDRRGGSGSMVRVVLGQRRTLWSRWVRWGWGAWVGLVGLVFWAPAFPSWTWNRWLALSLLVLIGVGSAVLERQRGVRWETWTALRLDEEERTLEPEPQAGAEAGEVWAWDDVAEWLYALREVPAASGTGHLPAAGLFVRHRDGRVATVVEAGSREDEVFQLSQWLARQTGAPIKQVGRGWSGEPAGPEAARSLQTRGA